jgi:hypothetical protein
MKYILPLLLFISYTLVYSQNDSDKEQIMDFELYEPISTLVVPEHRITKAKFPFIDVHSHQWNLTKDKIDQLEKEMRELNMAIMVNLSGRGYDRAVGDIGSQQYLSSMAKRIEGEASGKIALFTNVSFKEIGNPGWADEAVRQLEEDVKNGAVGLKIYKSLGKSSTNR